MEEENITETKKTPSKRTKSKVVVEKSVETVPTMTLEETKKEPKASNLPVDVQQTKRYAWLAYILFFIPLLINRNSPFVRHHANEGLEINIFDFIGALLLILGAAVKSSILWVQLLMIIFTIVGIILLTLTTVTKIYMIFSTLKGKAVTTPWFWNLRIIK